MLDSEIMHWRDKIMLLNEKILAKYRTEEKFSTEQLRRLLQLQMKAQFIALKNLTDVQLQTVLGEKTVVGIDGSVNTMGTTFPHYLTLFQALAKSSRKGEPGIWQQDLHTPLLSEERAKMLAQAKEAEIPLGLVQDSIKAIRLAELELQVADQALDRFACGVLLFDGPLWRYEKKSAALWPSFIKKAKEKQVLIVGVIEEVSSQVLTPVLADSLPLLMQDYYDRELLFGALQPGEAVYLVEACKPGYLTCFARPTADPQVVAYDFLPEQSANIPWLLDFLYTLTPKQGRGIPLWLDIVDQEVRISKPLLEGLVQHSLAPELVKKLLVPIKNKRIY